MTTKTDPDRPYHHGSLSSAALDVGRRLLAERDLDELSLREIAREVGVSAPAVYRHYPDKAALLRALAAQGIEELATAQQAASEAAGGYQEGFLAMGEAYIDFAVDNPALFRLIYAHPPEHDVMDPEWGGISTAMTLLLDASARFAPGGDDPRSFALHSWAVVHGLAMLILDGQVPADREARRAVLRSGWAVKRA